MRSTFFHSLITVLSLISLLSFSFSTVFVSSQPLTGSFDSTVSAGVDRISATTARVRFLPPAISAIDRLLIQITTNPAAFNPTTRTQFHNCLVFTPGTSCPFTITSNDREVNITQGATPITSYIIRDLVPNTQYQIRVAYLDKSTPQQVVGSTSIDKIDFATKPLSPSTALGSLIASGGCGSLTNTGVLTYLTSTLEGSERVYTCTVVSTISNVTLQLTADNAYESIESTPTPGLLTQANQTQTVASTQVDPLKTYNITLQLGAAGSITNFTFRATSESGATLDYKLSIRRALPSPAAQLTGPTSPVAALIRSPTKATSLIYRALLFQGASVSGPTNWKVWSEDLNAFPFTAFNITFPNQGNNDYTLASMNISPANPTADNTCSNIFVGLFDQFGRSQTLSTCVAAIDDICSPTPFGAATTWQAFVNATNTPPDQKELYHPAPPTTNFPKA